MKMNWFYHSESIEVLILFADMQCYPNGLTSLGLFLVSASQPITSFRKLIHFMDPLNL